MNRVPYPGLASQLPMLSLDTVRTDRRFTGQQLDGSGLYYYNARYYDPEIGHFISPDTIVPDPTSVFGYNRYMYAMGNPLAFVDPSGHIGVCFQGSRAAETEEGSTTQQLCQNLSEMYLLGNPVDGVTYRTFANDADDIQAAFDWIQGIEKDNPDGYGPLIVIGYSWGGGGALEFANMLNKADIGINGLVLIDPVQEMRGVSGQSGLDNFGAMAVEAAKRWLLGAGIPDNVEAAVNFYAGAEDMWVFNGETNVVGALNVELTEFVTDGQSRSVNHHNIMNASNRFGVSSGPAWGYIPGNSNGSLNTTTAAHVASWLYGLNALQPGGGPQ
ncbi:MAG: hypothetical protein H6642_15455 [Caldilineaceae bacterium]|nr:hypothetical protein [Caldilineaceae bacterium]